MDKQGKCFIKWWRHENDFAEVEEFKDFLETLNPNQEYARFDLLSMEDLWQELKRIQPRRVVLGQQQGKRVIRWQHRGDDGVMREDVYPYDPHALMLVFNQENGGNTLY